MLSYLNGIFQMKNKGDADSSHSLHGILPITTITLTVGGMASIPPSAFGYCSLWALTDSSSWFLLVRFSDLCDGEELDTVMLETFLL